MNDFRVGADATNIVLGPPVSTGHWYDYLNPQYWFDHRGWVADHLDPAARAKYLAAHADYIGDVLSSGPAHLNPYGKHSDAELRSALSRADAVHAQLQSAAQANPSLVAAYNDYVGAFARVRSHVESTLSSWFPGTAIDDAWDDLQAIMRRQQEIAAQAATPAYAVKMTAVNVTPRYTGPSQIIPVKNPESGAMMQVPLSRVQEGLNGLGYSPPLVVDGRMGDKTHAALRWFQAGQGLPATGMPDSATLFALDDPRPRVHGELSPWEFGAEAPPGRYKMRY